MTRTLRLGARLLALLAFLPALSVAQSQDEPLARTVLGIFDSATEQSARWSRVHRFAELPLNHLGLRVRYWDIQQGWPDARALAGVRGIVVWPRGYRVRDPEAIWQGMEQSLARGIGLALLGGPYEIADAWGNPPPLAASVNVLRHLGLAYTGLYEEVSLGWRISHADGPIIEFERRLSGPLPGFGIYRATGNKVNTHLVVTGSLRDGAATSHLATSQPGAAFVDSAFVLWQGGAEKNPSSQWRIDPFFVFRQAFNTDGFPKLDPTTASNRRVLFALVDGDGWNERSNFFNYRDQGATAADVLYREVLTRYTNLPFSIAPIGMDLDAQRPGTQRARRIAASMFSLPHVMPASHSYSHPLRWDDRPAQSLSSEAPAPVTESSAAWSRWIGDFLPASWHPSAPAVIGDRPADAGKSQIDYKLEFDTARAVVESVLPAVKPIPLLHWSGDAVPNASALQEAGRRGWFTIGGGPVAPRAHFSYSNVAPFGFVEGNALQVYLGNENETDVIAGWPSREALRRRLTATDAPRRVSPLGLYFHVGCASDTRRLNTLRAALETVLDEAAIPTWPHAYAEAVAGFQSAEIIPAGTNAWRIRRRGGLHSVRFDNIARQQLDFTRSIGVLAARHQGEVLYVALDPAVSESLVVVRDRATVQHPETWPMLQHANWHARALRRTRDSVEFIAAGFGAGDFQWRAAPRSAFAVRVFRGSELLWQQEVRTDAEGHLQLKLPALGVTPVAIALQNTSHGRLKAPA